MQIVNGYICMNCCDIDKARLGQDLHQQTNQIQKQLRQLIDKPTSTPFGPAVTFAGSLQAPTEGDAAAAVGSSEATLAASGLVSSSSVDILA
jgi:hypothetical protein